MRRGDLRHGLQTVPLPDEFEARRRSWPVIRAAFAEREPARRRLPVRTLVVLAAALAVVASSLSPPGMAVIDRVREAIGVEEAEPALFSLPATGRLLVMSDSGPWIVHPDGSKRRLGRWREASWSPFGRFVVAARRNELAALEPDGDVRWKLARRDVRLPRWGGSPVDTRIAYLTRSRLHVVAGDGTGDVDAGGLPAAARVAPAWRPGTGHVLAYVSTRGRVHVYDAGSGSLEWRSAPFPRARLLAWSDDGARLVLVTAERVVVFGARGPRPLAVHRLPGVVDAAFAPASRSIALARSRDVLVVGADRPSARPRMLFAGAGRFSDVAWSPDGRWLLVAWRDADQWVFVRSAGERRIEAVSDVTAQFESRTFPRVATWCCAR